MYYVLKEVEDSMDRLNQNINFEIEPKYMCGQWDNRFVKYIRFDFIPDTFMLNGSDKSGSVCYTNRDWEFTLATYVGYGGLRMTPKTIQYRHIDFCKAYDKIVEVGLDPKNISVEDLQLLKILDKDNEIIYNLFVNDK